MMKTALENVRNCLRRQLRDMPPEDWSGFLVMVRALTQRIEYEAQAGQIINLFDEKTRHGAGKRVK